PQKHMVGLVYATVVGDAPLAAEARKLAERSQLPAAQLDDLERFARGDASVPAGLDARAQAALLVARGASSSPAAIPADAIEACRTSELPAAAIVELMAWLS